MKEASHTKSSSTNNLRLLPEIGLVDLADPSLAERLAGKVGVQLADPMESMIEIGRDHARDVKRWPPGDMRLRWAAAGMLEASKQCRRVKGYRQLPPARRCPSPHRRCRRSVRHRCHCLTV